MKRVTPYYFLDRCRLSRVEALIQPILIEIARRWWPKTESVHINAKEYVSTDFAARAEVRHIYQCDDQYLIFVGTDRQWTAAASAWLGVSVDQSSSLTKELESQYCGDLASSISADFHASSDSMDFQKILTSYLRPGAGGMVLEITIDGFTHKLLTTAEIFPLIFEQEDTVRNLKLVNVADALDECTVVLEARLVPTKLPLLDVAALSPGDFLNLKHDLSGEIILMGKNTDVLIRAELGQRGNCKAALIISESGK